MSFIRNLVNYLLDWIYAAWTSVFSGNTAPAEATQPVSTIETLTQPTAVITTPEQTISRVVTISTPIPVEETQTNTVAEPETAETNGDSQNQ